VRGEAARGARRRRNLRGVSRQPVADIASRYAHHLLDKGSILFGRRKLRVRDEVIHGVQPGSVEVAEPRGLHGRGFAREYAEAVAGGVAGEVDQDIDGVACDHPLQPAVVESGGASPNGGAGAHARGPLIGRAGRVAEDFYLLWVVGLQYGREEISDRVRPQIAGDVADAQAAPWIPRVGVNARD